LTFLISDSQLHDYCHFEHVISCISEPIVDVSVEGRQLITAIPDESDTHRVMTALILVVFILVCLKLV
jgi:hypothetical protein